MSHLPRHVPVEPSIRHPPSSLLTHPPTAPPTHNSPPTTCTRAFDAPTPHVKLSPLFHALVNQTTGGPMFGRASYTWDLMRASWNVLKRDKGLLVFPLLSGICCLLVLASFAVPIFLSHAWEPPTRNAV